MAKRNLHDARPDIEVYQEESQPDAQEIRFIVSFRGTTVSIAYQRNGLDSEAIASELIEAVGGCAGPLLDRMTGLLEEMPQGGEAQQILPGLVKLEFLDASLIATRFPTSQDEDDAEGENRWRESSAMIECNLEVLLAYQPIGETGDGAQEEATSSNEDDAVRYREKAIEIIMSLPGIGDEVSLESRTHEYDVRLQLETSNCKHWQNQAIVEESADQASSLNEQQQAARKLEDIARNHHEGTVRLVATAETEAEKRTIVEERKQQLYALLGKGFNDAVNNRNNLPHDSEEFRLQTFDNLDEAEKQAVSFALQQRAGESKLSDADIRNMADDEARLTAKFYSGSSTYGDHLAVELALYHQRSGTPATGKEAEDCHRRAAMRTVGLTEEDLRAGKTFGKWVAPDNTEYIVQVMPEFSSTALTDLVIRVWDPREEKVFYLSDQYKSYKRNTVLGEEARSNDYSPPHKKDLGVVMTRGKTDNNLSPEDSLEGVMMRALAWTGIIDSSAYVLRGEERDELYIHRTQVVKPEVREAIVMSKQSTDAFELEKLQNQDDPPSYKMVAKVPVPGIKGPSGDDIEVRIETDLRVRAVKNTNGEWVPPKRRRDGYWNLDTVKSSDATEIVVPDEGWTCLLETKTAGSNTLGVDPGSVLDAENQIDNWAYRANF
jgi:hypothetical protein